MNRPLRVISVTCLVAIAIFLVWKFGIGWRDAMRQSRLEETVHSAMASPTEFVRSRVTGGVGVALMIDSGSGLPRVGSVLPGSPAESAGLLPGDFITKVGDWETAGQPLSNIVEAIRGFAGAKVDVTVRRATGTNSTNLTFAIHRSSWNALGVTNSISTVPAIMMTNPGTILLTTNITN